MTNPGYHSPLPFACLIEENRMTAHRPLVSQRHYLYALLALAAMPALATAQGLPSAKDLIDKWAKEVNATAWKGHKNAKSTATFEIPAAGISSTMTTMQSFDPPMSHSKVELPGMGEMRTGFDGKVAWQINPMQGPSILSGDMLTAQQEEGDPNNYSRQSAAIVSSETVEKVGSGDTECYKVKHTWKSGRNSFDCFGVSDGFIVWSQTKVKTEMGEMEVTTNFSEYKDFGGIKRASKTKLSQMGQEFIVTLKTWEWDSVDPKEFELPAEIKALVKK